MELLMTLKIINLSINFPPSLWLDPGSGSILIQLILGAVLGLGVVVRVFCKNVKEFFSGGKKRVEEAADPTVVTEDLTRTLDGIDDTLTDPKL